MTRRNFAVAAAAAAAPAKAAGGKLAILGGEPVRRGAWPSWPKQGKLEEDEILAVLRSGHWGRTTGNRVAHFEEAYAKLTGARYCIATANGTSALIAALNALDVGPGDEVLLPPYTFVATLNVVLLQHALPLFVDTDIETFQMDHRKLEATAGKDTVAVIPVHLGGSAANLDAIVPLARKKGWRVVEDACQAHLGEWRGKKVGSLGDAGCFSFQASKNLNSGEGGAIISNDDAFMDRAYSFHSNGRARKMAPAGFSYASAGANLRLTEFQAVLLEAQMTRLEEQSKLREQNAAYLTKMLEEIPGIHPARMYDGCTRNAWHLYMFRYDREAFAGVPRRQFLQALGQEGVPGSGGYSPLNKEPFLLAIAASPQWKRIFGETRLNEWRERIQCPVNDRLCEQAVWFTQTMLLGTRGDMEMIAAAVRKIQSQASGLRATASSAG